MARPRKYESGADRQAAYRARVKAAADLAEQERVAHYRAKCTEFELVLEQVVPALPDKLGEVLRYSKRDLASRAARQVVYGYSY